MDGQVLNTFREACLENGLLEDDKHWEETLEEAEACRVPKQMRSLFAVMLMSCEISNPMGLWDKYKEGFSEDILFQAQQVNPEAQFDETTFNKALILMEDHLINLGGQNIEQYGLPKPNRNQEVHIAQEIMRELSYDIESLENHVEDNEPRLTTDQKLAYDLVMQSINKKEGGMFFIDAPGGTGKTFLICMFLAQVRRKRDIALAVASSGIAATLLPGGRTAHSTFKLPFDLTSTDEPLCNVSRGSATGNLLKKASLIVWDECTMAHKYAIKALDRTLQDLRGNNSPMGGVVFLMAGDFRQTLPVIPKGTKADEIKACIKSSYLWPRVKKLKLETNMRVALRGDTSAGDFAQKLLEIGNGNILEGREDGLIRLNCGTKCSNLEEIEEKVFPSIVQNYKDTRWLSERALLAPKNISVDKVNDHILAKIPGAVMMYSSVDSVVDEEEAVQYPMEFLNSLEPPGMPPHLLFLKIGVPIILLRNIDSPRLCNGTRLVIKKMMSRVLEATIITGKYAGEDVFIPRIPLRPSNLPIQF